MTTGTGRRVLLAAVSLLAFLGVPRMQAQEALLPLRHAVATPAKADTALTLPFFDDFATPAAPVPWDSRGVFFNDGYAPWPPTVGMATLDAFDADGCLYPTAIGSLFFGDTLCSPPLRLDSLFEPFPRPLTVADSLCLSFYYLPGGGYGDMWERIGDCPGADDSLLLEFYDPAADRWHLVWGRGGEPVDSLVARTGTDWQHVVIPLTDSQYFAAGFRFRFRNYCSLDNAPKPGILSNSDQWNLDYILLDRDRRVAAGRTSRDVAFVHPAPSLLKEFTAMPARQYNPADLADSLPLVITNLYSEELATHYTYSLLDADGRQLDSYDGGFENAPVFWPARQYQTARAHSRPPLTFRFPADGQPAEYTVVHTLREGVSGDLHGGNDTLRGTLRLGDCYAYDDGTPENGYGITSTASRVRLAVDFPLRNADTLTAVDLYFNRTYDDGNASIRFRLTVWDDGGGRPGNIIYQDSDLRHPRFEGLNRYVRYPLEQPLPVDGGTLYVGLEQLSSDYINLGFDRNRDASARIHYLTGVEWQTSILRGALMLRPCFGASALLSAAPAAPLRGRAWVAGGRLRVDNPDRLPVAVYDALGRTLDPHAPLPTGVIIVKIGPKAFKISRPLE